MIAGVEVTVLTGRSAAGCRQAISCDLRRNQRQLTTGNVLALTSSCRIVEVISTGVYVPEWIACALLYRAKLRSCTMTNPQRGLKSRGTVAQVWRVVSRSSKSLFGL